MARREHLLGIAEKMPKSAMKMPKASPSRIGRPTIVTLQGRRVRKRH
jgi:phosphoribosyl-ATP pyrophosphohydrolase